MKRLIFILTLITVVFVFPIASYASGKSTRQQIMAVTEVAAGAPVLISGLNTPNNSRGYLIVETTNETSTCTLTVILYGMLQGGNQPLCTLTAITANTTWIVAIGEIFEGFTPSESIDQICEWPIPDQYAVGFTCAGAGADFDVAADIYWLTD